MNRLDLTKMVNKNIRNQKETNFFNATQINTKDLYDYKRYKAKLTEDHINIAAQINNIVTHVHRQLKNRKPSATKHSTKFDMLKENSIVKFPERKEKVREDKDNIAQIKQKENKKKLIIVDNTDNIKISIPRMKALCNRKIQKRTHQAMSAPSNPKSLVNHKRIQEVLQQKVLLEKMLQDHKQLQHDRQTIAQEIFMMRSYLDNIRGRLNFSLKKLDNNKTYCECHGLTSCKSCRKSV